ncbi:trypsin-1 isoform X2 [Bradysia coprophila]|uniref:trypsin-1 isoform X2 n=1 Tax=Bradysia coprophila TaxID=38358 RepID=UPI00187DAB80|nr:trypsin-1 isoform X2 [Bradysia coprophila]
MKIILSHLRHAGWGKNCLWCRDSKCINFPLSYRSSRVVGGTNAEESEFPFIVSLTRRGGHFCGATIVNDQWLLTAGHCVCNGLNRFMKPNQIKSVIGLHTMSSFKDNAIESSAFEMNIRTIVTHPDYRCESVKDDIALLRLHKTIIFTDVVKPACILSSENNYEGDVAVVSGWGWTMEDQSTGDPANILQKASVNVWKNSDCQKSFREKGSDIILTENQICAGHVSGGIDSCWADSGGPLITPNHSLIGVVSTGVGCGRPGLPGIYTRVSKYINWIKQTIEIK